MKKNKIIPFLSMIIATSLILSACASAPPPMANRADNNSPTQEKNSPVDSPNADTKTNRPAQEKDLSINDPNSGAQANDENKSVEDSTAFPYSPENDQKNYLPIKDNQVTNTQDQPLITFSLKIDTASYSNIERYIQSGTLPPPDAVRIEEMLNYFNYDAPLSDSSQPFSSYTEVGPSPFNPSKYMAFVRIKTKDIDPQELPKSNLTFLIDTSGSMESYEKLPLLKEAFSLLVDTLGEDDRISIVTYAGSSAVVLDSARGSEKDKILDALNNLTAGGSTAGADGILTAYSLAEKNFIPGGNNRILLATDGDFNVGLSDPNDLANLVSEKKDNQIYLSLLGFGTDNLRDDMMETLSKNGNGNYSYIHSLSDAQKVLVDELSANLFTIADDVKAQIEFNPENVKSYRLIGYENRIMDNKDFNDDTKDAGEIGVGTDVVFMYELELTSGSTNNNEPTLKYQPDATVTTNQKSDEDFGQELFEIRIRYKNPGENDSQLFLKPVNYADITNTTSLDFNFASSVAAFGQLLRQSDYNDQADLNSIYQLASQNIGKDKGHYRQSFLLLLKQAEDLQ